MPCQLAQAVDAYRFLRLQGHYGAAVCVTGSDQLDLRQFVRRTLRAELWVHRINTWVVIGGS